MEGFVAALRTEYPELQGNNGMFSQGLEGYDILVRDFADWWKDLPNQNYPGDLQVDFTGQPFHITSLSNAFQILTTGQINPGPGQHARFGDDCSVIYFGFPDFHRHNMSTYGSVSFRMTPQALFGANPKFFYRYTMKYNQERSHLFLLSQQGATLPAVALREYPVGGDNNGIWWLVNDENGVPTVHFRKKNDFEYIEFAVLRNGVDDVVPLADIDGIRFQRKHLTLGNDRPDFEDSEQFLVLALGLFYLGNIPAHILGKFGTIDVESLGQAQRDLVAAFGDTIDAGLDIPNPFKDIAVTIDQIVSPVDVLCERLGMHISNQAHTDTDNVPTFSSSIHYLRQRNSWILEPLQIRVQGIFDQIINAIGAHNIQWNGGTQDLDPHGTSSSAPTMPIPTKAVADGTV